MVKLKTEFDKWKSGKKKAKSLRRKIFLKKFGEKPRIRGFTDGEPQQFKISCGYRGKAPLKCFMAKDADSMIFQPTEDGKWSCGPFKILKFMELLLQLHHSRETVFMGKRSEARLMIYGWDKFLGMNLMQIMELDGHFLVITQISELKMRLWNMF